jgi:Ca2+:H+ antiporter
MSLMLALLAFVPISLALKYLVHAPDPWIFGAALISIIPIANAIRQATEELAKRTGSSIGGLLNVTFGNVSELILALFVLAAGQGDVAKAQITGSIIGNGLLGLGLAAFFGGLKWPAQKFGRQKAGQLSSMLMLSLFALLIPAMFDYTERAKFPYSDPRQLDDRMSLGVSLLLLLLYGANLVYTMVTHRDIFRADNPDELSHGAAKAWPLWKSIGLLLGGTALVAVQCEMISGALESTAAQFGLSTFFLGITVLAVVGNAAEYISAIYFARKNQMGMVMTITAGSSIQVALMVAPILMLASFALGKPMNLIFGSPLELVAVAATVFAVNTIAQDGETSWFEGILLVGIYAILGVAFFYVAPGTPVHR